MRLPLVLACAAVGGGLLLHPAVASPPGDRLLRDVVAGFGEQGEDDIATPSAGDITAEPSIAANPDHPANAVLAFKIGYGEAIGVATTSDGGRTWSSTVLPCTNRPNTDGCGSDAATPTTDPVVAFGRHGVVHVAYIQHASDDIDLSTSYDGGSTWGHPEVAVQPTDPGGGLIRSHDKEWMAVDLGTGAGHHPGRIYLVWAQEPQGSPQATYSDDGISWAPVTDFPLGHGSDFHAVVLADGSLGVFYDTGDTAATGAPNAGVPSAPEQYEFVRALVPTTGASLALGNPVIVGPAMHRDEADQTAVLDGATAAVDPVSGRIYAAWTDSSHTPTFNVIALASSDDNGATWSTPTVAARDTAGDVFHPALSVGADRRVHLAWRDRPAPGGALGTELDSYAAESDDVGASFLPAVRLSGVSTDTTYAQRPVYPASNGWFVGDYDESATSGPLTYVARAEAYAVAPPAQFCPQVADTVQQGCMPAPHERIWVGVLGRR